MPHHTLRMQERIFNPEWMTFPVDTPEQDAAVLLFDMLYERLTVFTRQYWMGELAGVQGAKREQALPALVAARASGCRLSN